MQQVQQHQSVGLAQGTEKISWARAMIFAVGYFFLAAILIGQLPSTVYGYLALGELRNPDRRDLGTTPAIRWMIIGSILLLILFLFIYNTNGFATISSNIFPHNPFYAFKLSQLAVSFLLGAAVIMALGAFALRLHYLMRPIRKRTMSVLYAVGAIGLAQTGALFIVLWIVA